MSTSLTLVVDNSAATQNARSSAQSGSALDPAEPSHWVHAGWTHRQTRRRRLLGTTRSRMAQWRREALARSDRGAVTAEYAIVIMAAVAFAGLLVAIMRSGEIRAMLVDLVQNALGSAG
ncbi:DUF4244 domain-containing protein [Leucobacter sp. W1478]|uniref:DUF4244 domain-containing protein n=1 Tax=Leucobacter sp. W1478 TaxID=3439065 RepID=UPI003F378EB9